MNILRKGAAAIFAVLFVITAPLALLLVNLERGAFSTRTYQLALASQGFYERLPTLLSESLSGPLEALPFSVRGLGQQEREALARRLLPPEIAREMADQALGSVLGYLRDEADSAVVDMSPLKERIAGEAGTQAVMDLVRAQPACTLAEISNMAGALLSGGELSLCNPPQDFYSVLVPVIQVQLQAISAAVPDQITLARSNPVPGQADPRTRIRVLRLGMRLGLVVPLIFLLFVTVLGVRSLRDWLLWWGALFLPSGLLCMAMGAVGAPLAGFLLLYFVTPRLGTILPSAVLKSGDDLATAIASQLLSPVLIQGILLAFLGAALLVLAFGVARTRGRF